MNEKEEGLRRQAMRVLNQLQLLQTSMNVVADEAIDLARQLGVQFPQQPPMVQPQQREEVKEVPKK